MSFSTDWWKNEEAGKNTVFVISINFGFKIMKVKKGRLGKTDNVLIAIHQANWSVKIKLIVEYVIITAIYRPIYF